MRVELLILFGRAGAADVDSEQIEPLGEHFRPRDFPFGNDDDRRLADCQSRVLIGRALDAARHHQPDMDAILHRVGFDGVKQPRAFNSVARQGRCRSADILAPSPQEPVEMAVEKGEAAACRRPQSLPRRRRRARSRGIKHGDFRRSGRRTSSPLTERMSTSSLRSSPTYSCEPAGGGVQGGGVLVREGRAFYSKVCGSGICPNSSGYQIHTTRTATKPLIMPAFVTTSLVLSLSKDVPASTKPSAWRGLFNSCRRKRCGQPNILRQAQDEGRGLRKQGSVNLKAPPGGNCLDLLRKRLNPPGSTT